MDISEAGLEDTFSLVNCMFSVTHVLNMDILPLWCSLFTNVLEIIVNIVDDVQTAKLIYETTNKITNSFHYNFCSSQSILVRPCSGNCVISVYTRSFWECLHRLFYNIYISSDFDDCEYLSCIQYKLNKVDNLLLPHTNVDVYGSSAVQIWNQEIFSTLELTDAKCKQINEIGHKVLPTLIKFTTFFLIFSIPT